MKIKNENPQVQNTLEEKQRGGGAFGAEAQEEGMETRAQVPKLNHTLAGVGTMLSVGFVQHCSTQSVGWLMWKKR